MPYISIYEEQHRRRMDEFEPGLWAHLDRLPQLEPQLARDILEYILSSCRTQHIANIMFGRKAICEIPREWLLANIEAAAEYLYSFNDSWEYLRLAEIYCELKDEGLLRRHVQRGFEMDNPEIQEAAQDFSDYQFS